MCIGMWDKKVDLRGLYRDLKQHLGGISIKKEIAK